MNSTQRHAVLATVSDGQPYTSLVAFAMTPDMKQAVFATPRNTSKYRNILNNRKVALLIDTRSNTDASYMKSEAVTIIGTARPVRRGSKNEALAGILAKKHHALRRFIRATTTAVTVVEAERCFHTGSFQQVSEWRVGKS
jgi:nitroimidazol reductase NimA-like FMN-containing flavoprotein (pyridoxamine 5'-phosphate oxidase superfamily)